MKKIINNKLYNTETARELGSYQYSAPRDFNWWCETLYQKRSGAFFLHGEGGPASRYAETVGLNQWSGGERIMPMTFEEARQWAEEHLDGDKYIEIFGEPEEDDTKKMLTLYLSNTAINIAKQAAARDNINISQWFEKLVMQEKDGIRFDLKRGF